MRKFLIRVLGLEGSWRWACKQMKKGEIVKPKGIPGSVKYRISKDNQNRIQWAFTNDKECKDWSNAFVHLSDFDSVSWEIWK